MASQKVCILIDLYLFKKEVKKICDNEQTMFFLFMPPKKQHQVFLKKKINNPISVRNRRHYFEFGLLRRT